MRALVGAAAVIAGLLGGVLHAANAAAGRTVVPSFWTMGLAAALGYGVLAVLLSGATTPALRRLVAGVGLAQGVALVASEWALLGPGVPARGAAAWLGSWLWAPAYVAVVTVLPMLLPDGRTAGRWGRPALWLGVTACGVTGATWALTPYEDQDFPLAFVGQQNPVGVPGVTHPAVTVGGGVLIVAAAAAGIASLVLRWRAARTVERQQLKWVVLGLVATLVLIGLGRVVPVEVTGVMAGLAVLALPVAIGVAVLRHGLWDVDVVISRSLLYAALSGLVVAAYVLTVWLLGLLIGTSVSSTTLSALATAAVALAALPLHARLQRVVNRLVHGDVDEPYAVLARVGDRLAAATDPDDLAERVLPSVVEQVARALRARGATLTLADGGTARFGTPGGESEVAIDVPLEYGGRQVGHLEVTRPGGFGWADQRALERLGRQASVAAHTVLLARDARRAREETVVAREEERRRLRRDLHDGVGPSLAAVALQVETARHLAADDPTAAVELLDRLVPRLNAAVSDVRALVHELRPPTLDELGLASAVRELAARLSSPGTRVVVTAAELGPLTAAVEVAAYRIVGEAVTNAVRHAGARTVEVRLVHDHQDGNGLRLEVDDDGAGIVGSPVPGVGLSSMRQRAEELGGTMSVQPRLGGGTRVSALLPMTAIATEVTV